MKLEVGMYVRFNGMINKIIEKDGNYIVFDNNWYDDWWGEACNMDTDVFIRDYKPLASFNVIDLFEEKDLVEIEFYSLRAEKRITRLFEVDFKDDSHITFNNAHCQLNIVDGIWSDADLKPVFKSIVTKEPFENVKYRIGDE